MNRRSVSFIWTCWTAKLRPFRMSQGGAGDEWVTLSCRCGSTSVCRCRRVAEPRGETAGGGQVRLRFRFWFCWQNSVGFWKRACGDRNSGSAGHLLHIACFSLLSSDISVVYLLFFSYLFSCGFLWCIRFLFEHLKMSWKPWASTETYSFIIITQCN